MTSLEWKRHADCEDTSAYIMGDLCDGWCHVCDEKYRCIDSPYYMKKEKQKK